jgi:ribosomal protein L40E
MIYMMGLEKNKRGNKICEKCGGGNGPRAFNCKHCDHPFKIKKGFRKTRRKKDIDDWTNLTQGIMIRVVGGSGPYYKDENGDCHYLTDRGLYTVIGLAEYGLHVISVKGGDKQFLYMGPVSKSNLCWNLFRSPHKLQLV